MSFRVSRPRAKVVTHAHRSNRFHKNERKIRPATLGHWAEIGRPSVLPACQLEFPQLARILLSRKNNTATGRPPPAPLEARQATTSAPPTGGAAAAVPTAPPSAVARRLSSGRRQVPRAEGATGPADARPAEPSSSTAGRAPPRRFSAHWRAEEAAGVAAGIGGGASSVLGSEADFERRSIDLRAGRWVALRHRRHRGGRRPDQRTSGRGVWRICYMLPAM